MSKEKLEVGFSPPEKKEAVDDKMEVILDFLEDKKISYPSEICGELDISKETVYRKLRFLQKQGVVERLTISNQVRAPDWLVPRLQDLWSRGIKGDAIKRMSWYRLSKAVKNAASSKKEC